MLIKSSRMKTLKYLTLLIIGFISNVGEIAELRAQEQKSWSSADIYIALKKLEVLGKVLYIGAHPDDENNKLIAYLSKELHLDVAYLSITRGEGGQNFIGSEVTTDLGILREQELLAARRIDGGKQFFTRAKDFGFSKNAEQTIQTWGEEETLRDIVWVIRYFQPDIIINRFSEDFPDHHGHHTASAILTKKAFEISGDPNVYPDQLKEVQTWQSKRLLWNIYSESGVKDIGGIIVPQPDYIKLNIGKYNSILGKSYAEIAAESRNQHRCQAMGATATVGEINEYFKLVSGESTQDNLFSTIETSWKRIGNSKKIENLIQDIITNYNPKDQEQIIHKLCKLLTELQKLPYSNWKLEKEKDIKELIVQTMGLKAVASVNKAILSPKEKYPLSIELENRSPISISDIKIHSNQLKVIQNIEKTKHELKGKDCLKLNAVIYVPDTSACYLPQHLKFKDKKGQYNVSNSKFACLPHDEAPYKLQLQFKLIDQTIELAIPINNIEYDPLVGKKQQPITIGPPVSINFSTNTIIAAGKKQVINLTLTTIQDSTEGEIILNIPKDWEIYPKTIPFRFSKAAQKQDFTFTLSLPETNTETELSAQVRINNIDYRQSHKKISYTHITKQEYYPEAKIKIVQTKIDNSARYVAYIKGTKDDMDKSLSQIVDRVDILTLPELEKENLKKYDAIILGLRLYNIHPSINQYQETLKKYIEDGGVVISQYNTNYDLLENKAGIFPLAISSKRICDENSPITILEPKSPILSYPNQITENDFKKWVQERAIFIPQKWDKQFTPILSSRDINEGAQEGLLLLRPQGKGYYVYCSLALHRQLPAGIPGAYRLFANMLSLGKQNVEYNN